MGPTITDFYNSLLTIIKKNDIRLVSLHIGKFKNLQQKRFGFNDQDMFGKTLVHYLVEHLNTLEVAYAASILDKFLELGIDLNIKDSSGKSAIDLCSKDPARTTVLEKLTQYQAANPVATIKKSVLQRMAVDPTSVIMGSIDGKNTKNYLEGFPHIYECHCCDALAREAEGVDLRKSFEDKTLQYLKEILGENEVTIVGSGNLLDTLVLIAKFKKDNPGSTLRLNLIEKDYDANSGHKIKELFEDFVRCLKENNIQLTVAENQTNIPVASVVNNAAEFSLVISLHNDFNKYLELHRIPKLLVAADLDCEQYALRQHDIVADLAKKAQAKAFVSVSTASLKQDKVVVVAPMPVVAAASLQANPQPVTPTLNSVKEAASPPPATAPSLLVPSPKPEKPGY